MRKQTEFRDVRVKKKIFPVSTFLSVFVVFGVFTTIQMKIIGEEINYQSIPIHHVIMVLGVWFLAATAFTFWTNYQITRYYQKPVEEFFGSGTQGGFRRFFRLSCTPSHSG